MPTSSRLVYLDALRSFAMIYGVLVHTTTIGAPHSLDWIATVSGFFRMAAFFLVSGFLAAMMLERLAAVDFIRRRALALLVPFASGVLLLNPVTNYLVYTYHNPPVSIWGYLTLPEGVPAAGPMVWHLHLWFLLALFFYVLTAPLALAAARRLPAVAGALSRMVTASPAWIVVPVTALTLSIATVAARVGFELTLAHALDGTPVSWLVQATLHYWPYFLTGMTIFHHAGFREKFQSLSLPALVIATTLLIGFHYGLQGRSGPLYEVAAIFSKAFMTTTIVAALLAFFKRFFSAESALTRASDYIYTVYIFHYLFIYVVAHAIRPLGLNDYVVFAAIAGTAYVTTFALHKYCISRSALLRLLFNGKPLPKRDARAAGPEPATPSAAAPAPRIDGAREATGPAPG